MGAEKEKPKLSRDSHEKFLIVCNDNGAIILRLIKILLEPLSTDIVKAYAGEEAGVGLHDIGNTIAEAWSARENFLYILNGGEELWKKHNRDVCLLLCKK